MTSMPGVEVSSRYSSVSPGRRGYSLTPDGYDLIAGHYYSPEHWTTRNLEQATVEHFRGRQCPIPSAGHTLVDLGAGRGMVGAYLGRHLRYRVWAQIDTSHRMLSDTVGGDATVSAKIRADALRSALPSGIADVVTAFLFDPYNRPTLAHEIRRLLRHDGTFVGTIPAQEWARPCRQLQGVPQDTAIFRHTNGEPIYVPSHVCGNRELRERFINAGFTYVDVTEAYLPLHAEASPHVACVHRSREVELERLPIVTVIVAR